MKYVLALVLFVAVAAGQTVEETPKQLRSSWGSLGREVLLGAIDAELGRLDKKLDDLEEYADETLRLIGGNDAELREEVRKVLAETRQLQAGIIGEVQEAQTDPHASLVVLLFRVRSEARELVATAKQNVNWTFVWYNIRRDPGLNIF